MSSETIYDYKGYKIKIHFAHWRGAWYRIFKVEGDKWYPVRSLNFNFCEPDTLLQMAKDYIDKFPEKLEAKYLDRIKTYLDKK